MRRRVHGIALGQLLHAVLVLKHHADVGGAVGVGSAEGEIARVRAGANVLEFEIVIVPKPPFLRAEVLGREQRAQAAALQRVNESSLVLASADARDDHRSRALRGAALPPQHPSGKKPAALRFPGIPLLRTDFALANLIGVRALDRAWWRITDLQSDFALREINNRRPHVGTLTEHVVWKKLDLGTVTRLEELYLVAVWIRNNSAASPLGVFCRC